MKPLKFLMGEGQSMTDLERNNRLLNRLTAVIMFYGAVILAIIMFIIWKFYSTGYFNHLLARCGG